MLPRTPAALDRQRSWRRGAPRSQSSTTDTCRPRGAAPIGLPGVISGTAIAGSPCERALIMSGGPSTSTTQWMVRRRGGGSAPAGCRARRASSAHGHGWARSAALRAARRDVRIGTITRPRTNPHPSASRVSRDHTRRCSSRSSRAGQRKAASRSCACANCCSSTASSARPAGAGSLAGGWSWRRGGVDRRVGRPEPEPRVARP